jgi:hypothetical protein
MTGMNRRIAATASAVVMFVPPWLAGCGGLIGPRNVTLSQAQLQSAVERQFPLQRRLLEVIDVTIARPVLRLLPERNRIGTDLDLSATERLSGRVVRGSLALDYALRYEPSDASVRLSQVRVQDAKLDMGSGPLSPSGARLAALLAERLLDDVALYRADPERLQQLQRLGITAAEIAVTPGGVEVRFAQPK